MLHFTDERTASVKETAAMPYYWQPEEKARAIQTLIEMLGSTYLTSQNTGIPERTIQQWKSEMTNGIKTALVQHEPEDSLEQVIHARYEHLRNDLLEHLGKLSDQFRTNPADATDLAIAMARLIDRLHKLETILQARHFSLIILFEHPDGTIRDTLPVESVKKLSDGSGMPQLGKLGW
jgi:hypothetical protein